ncbi:threonine dehydratase [Carbonactinospora thermoautotrophica]|uniref:threonine ammonia-lyase n=3 Tax=Carbonactinospora thermoautotrophica TaxID=1469144 RepID=A0A132MJV6_9ACTN|nr:threonine/serine dehydratase [Carbonactinospora thermoautotrophica]KWW98162.1 threonine dehydratase [Carbonactinospora thermoautotrophica]
MASRESTVTLDDLRAAQRRVAGVAVRTPLLPCPWADADRPLYLKPENLQPIGAFKIRGAINKIAALPEEERARGVVTHSSGNHAQAVAYAARRYGVPATVVVPHGTPPLKVAATQAFGAEIEFVAPAERGPRAEKLAAELGRTLVPPYDDPYVIAGQGTVGLEIAEDLPEPGTVLVPVSGGGLISGVAAAVKALSPRTRVIGVEPELAADTYESFRRGELVRWDTDRRFRTIADGLRMEPSQLTWAHIQAYVDDLVTVTEDQIREAVGVLARRARLVAEPSGAVTTAAYLFQRDRLPAAGPCVAVISGGNIDPALLAEILAG